MNNRHIQVGHKVIKIESWTNRGIKYIGNIVNEKGYIMSKKEMEATYGFKCQYLQYESITAAIPANWKIITKDNEGLVCIDITDTARYIKMEIL